MIGSDLNHRLSAMDAFFLYIEREEAPAHVGCINILDGPLQYKKFVKNLNSRIHLIPRYMQRVVPAPFNIGHPTWEFDPDFEIENHIFEIDLEPGASEDTLREVAGQVFESPLDRNKPLWEIHLVNGLENRNSAMLVKIHHAMIDGIAGMALLYIVMDTVPNPPKVKKERVKLPELPDTTARVYDALWDNAITTFGHWTKFQRNMNLYSDGQDPAEMKASLREFGIRMKGFLSPIKRMPFNKPFNGVRRFAWGDFSFAEAREIRAVCGGTFNDVMLTVLSGAVRRFAECHKFDTRGEGLRVLVPVNIRTEEERGQMGNRVVFLPVEVPLDIHDPIERLRHISETTKTLKERRVPEAINLMFEALQGVSVPVQANLLSNVAGGPGKSFLSILSQVPPLHMICTNVPGPQIPLYTNGRKLLKYYGLVPLLFDMGLNCAILSYNQMAHVCFVADDACAPDIERVMDYFEESFEELRIRADVEQKYHVEIDRAYKARNNGNGKPNGAVTPLPGIPPSQRKKRRSTAASPASN
jgi:WS/DGAT/MGAT family acyltransferase